MIVVRNVVRPRFGMAREAVAPTYEDLAAMERMPRAETRATAEG